MSVKIEPSGLYGEHGEWIEILKNDYYNAKYSNKDNNFEDNYMSEMPEYGEDDDDELYYRKIYKIADKINALIEYYEYMLNYLLEINKNNKSFMDGWELGQIDLFQDVLVDLKKL